ncbi:MAG: hypothetical protein JST63_16520 [Bacteroidetes bacterium]|nr:hypothetical protein [Bacteroidota bacterium]
MKFFHLGFTCYLPVMAGLLMFLSCHNTVTKEIPVYEKEISDTVKVLLRKAAAQQTADYQQAFSYYEDAIRVAKQSDDDAGLVAAYRNIVFTCGVLMNEYDRALTISDSAIAFAHQLGDANTLCDFYGVRALVYQVRGDVDSASDNYKTALEYMEQDTAPDSLKNWPLYLNAADLYSTLDNQLMAIEYTWIYIQNYAEKRKDTARLVTAYNNLSMYYTRKKDTAQAESNILKSYYWMRSMPSHINADAVYSNLTNMYNAKRRFDSALLYGQKRLDLNIMLKDNVGIARSYAGIIEIAANSGDKQLAQRIIREHNPIAYFETEKDLPVQDRQPLFDGYYKMYDLLGKQKNAYYFLQIAYKAERKVHEMAQNNKLEQFELERKRVMTQNAILSNQLKIQHKNITIAFLIIVSICLVIFIYSIWYEYKRRLTFHKKQIEMLEQEKQWNKTISVLEGQLEERNRISRELHDDLGASLTSIALASNIIRTKNKQESDNELDLIHAAASKLITTLNEIVWSLNSSNDSLFGLVAYIRKFASGFLDSAGIALETNEQLPAQDIVAPSRIRRAVYLTAKEALNNIVKHSKATKVVIAFSVTNNMLDIIIRDDGNGLQHESKNSGGGNGMKNMQKNMSLINGRCNITEENPGLSVQITIQL